LKGRDQHVLRTLTFSVKYIGSTREESYHSKESALVDVVLPAS